jgi:hypothetical protein
MMRNNTWGGLEEEPKKERLSKMQEGKIYVLDVYSSARLSVRAASGEVKVHPRPPQLRRRGPSEKRLPWINSRPRRETKHGRGGDSDRSSRGRSRVVCARSRFLPGHAHTTLHLALFAPVAANNRGQFKRRRQSPGRHLE